MKQNLITAISIVLLTITSFATESNNTIDENISIEINSTVDKNITIDENIPIEVNTGNCIGCHGENFEKSAMGISNIVKDMTKEYIEATLFNYKYNSNPGNMDALMSWQTAKLTDDEIRNIAKSIGKN